MLPFITLQISIIGIAEGTVNDRRDEDRENAVNTARRVAHLSTIHWRRRGACPQTKDRKFVIQVRFGSQAEVIGTCRGRLVFT